MSMEKSFTDNEIIKALNICVKYGSCKECPINPKHGNYGYCTNLALMHALDLINRYKAEIERLKKECEAHRNTVIENEQRFLALNLELESEIDKQYEQAKADILGNISDGGTSCHWCIAQHESEARKEFAERLDELFAEHKNDAPIIWARSTMELLLQEMESESNAE